MFQFAVCTKIFGVNKNFDSLKELVNDLIENKFFEFGFELIITFSFKS